MSRIRLTLKHFHYGAILIGLGGFFASLVWEALGFYPCLFCLIERWMFLGIGAIGLLGVLPRWRLPLLAVNGFWSLALSVVLVRHIGIQYHWWALPKACQARIPKGTAEEMMAFIEKAPPVSCDQIELTFLGLAPTVYLFLCTFSLTLIFFWGFLKDDSIL